MEGKNKVEQLASNLKEYAETRLDIVILNLEDKVSDILSSIASIAIITILAMLIVFFGSVGAAWWVGQLLHNPSVGFFSVAAFYLIVAIVIYANRDNWIKVPIINAILKKINFNEKD